MALVAALASGAVRAEPQRLDGLGPADIASLQARLTDARCYTGPIDGKGGPALDTAIAACPDQRPQLQIETGMHVAGLRRIDADAACRLAATASDDKTVRVWSLPDGRLLHVLRRPVGPGDKGQAYAVAVSPDGRFVAAGGRDAGPGATNAVSVFDAASGAMVAHVGAYPKSIKDLAFSADGHWLAVALGAPGIRVIDATGWREVAADASYVGEAYGVAFAPDGRLYSTAIDGKLRRYAPGPAFTREAEIATRGGRQAYGVAVDPDNRTIAVGFADHLTVDLYDARTFRFLRPAQTRGLGSGDLLAVAWRRDGRALIAGGGAGDMSGRNAALLFDPSGRRISAPIPLSANRIISLKPCGAGFAEASLDPAFGLLGPDGGKLLWRESVAPDLRGKRGEAFLVSADARRVRFGLGENEAQPVTFDLAAQTLGHDGGAAAGLAPPNLAGLRIEGWVNAGHPTFAGHPIALDSPNEVARALSVRKDASGILLGTSFWLRAYDSSGRLRWRQAALSEVTGVSFSADGEIAVTANGDGTIRWRRWSDGAELLALFVDRATRTWVAWTPSGYYAASPGGEDLIGWVVNRGWARAADFFPASRFRDTFARPDIVETVLATRDEAEAIRQANAARAGKMAPSRPLTDSLPPVISILSPRDGAEVGASLEVDYAVRSPSGLPVDAVEATIDGRPASTARGLGRAEPDTALAQCLTATRGLGRTEDGIEGCRGRLALSLPPGRSTIGLVARAGDRVSAVASLRVAVTGAPTEAPEKPRLYAFVVGISAYRDKAYQLAYPAKDARDFSAALQNQKGALYGDVEVRTLADGDATATAIRQGLDWLTKKVTRRDVGLLYLAGHGVLDPSGRFYFLAADSDATSLRATAVPREDIDAALAALAGKALLFLDTCHAGAVAGGNGPRLDINTVVNALAGNDQGVVVFAASTGRQLSEENPAWGNGAFTKAVVEGLGRSGVRAEADLRHDGRITTSELDVYVTERVKSLTDGAQSPVMIRPPTVPDFTFAASR